MNPFLPIDALEEILLLALREDTYELTNVFQGKCLQ